jgi:hypothetical protein
MIEDALNKLLMLDTRLVAYLVWGVGTTLVYGYVATGSYGDYVQQRDRRARRELIEDVGLFLTAITANLAIVMVLFGEQGGNMRGFLVALSLGAFTGVGILKGTERFNRKRNDDLDRDGRS